MIRAVIRVIDSISEYSGRVISWLCVILVLLLVFEVTSRYVFNHPTQWAHQSSMMASGAIIALGWAYVHVHGGHIRVDVLYGRFSPKGKALTDVVLDILVFFPLFIALTYVAWNKMWFSWEVHEIMTETFWHPPVGPNRTAIFIGLSLLTIQGVSNFIKSLYLLIKGKPYD